MTLESRPEPAPAKVIAVSHRRESYFGVREKHHRAREDRNKSDDVCFHVAVIGPQRARQRVLTSVSSRAAGKGVVRLAPGVTGGVSNAYGLTPLYSISSLRLRMIRAQANRATPCISANFPITVAEAKRAACRGLSPGRRRCRYTRAQRTP